MGYQFQVHAIRQRGERERLVYESDDAENASCFAEGYFIREHAQHVRCVDARQRLLRDRHGKDYVWSRLV